MSGGLYFNNNNDNNNNDNNKIIKIKEILLEFFFIYQ